MGGTFAEVGGLWGVVNEKVTVAHRLGATDVSMIDAHEEGGPLWKSFHDRLREAGIERCRCLPGDLLDHTGRAYDAVHCSGVLYHHPNPLLLLSSLRRITRRSLVLTSAVTATRVSNEQGTLATPESGVLFIPALPESERAVLAAHWRTAGAEAFGITTPCDFRLDDFGPWWFLPTAVALAAMCRTCGFEVVDAAHTWNDNAYTLLLSAA